MNTVLTDKDKQFSLYKFDWLDSLCQDEMIHTSFHANNRIRQFLGLQKESRDITWFYSKYNIFTVTNGDKNFYKLFVSINHSIKNYLTTHLLDIGNMLYMQSWLNIHTHNEVLKKHNHDSLIHGYVSIDPKNTITKFVDDQDNLIYSVVNSPGLMYIGPGKYYHEVINQSKWNGERITIAFDLNNTKNPHFSFIPIIL